MTEQEPCPMARWEDDGGPPPPGDADAPKVEVVKVGWIEELHSLIAEEDKNPPCGGEGCPYCVAGELPECIACVYGVCDEHGEEYKPVTLEAYGLVFGDRGADYGHPLDDFSRTAALWTTYLADILRPGTAIVAEDVGPIMVLLKLSRQRNRAKRDNLVDAAGYAETTERVIVERARRAKENGNASSS